jgi:hypothetical protein
VLRPLDFVDEARVALRADGHLWGFLEVLRRGASGPFGPADADVLGGLSAVLGGALRRLSVIAGRSGEGSADDDPPAVVVCAADGTILAASAHGRRLLGELGTAWGLPPAVQSAVIAVQGAPAVRPVTARVRSPAGRWLTIGASPLEQGAGRSAVAVTLQPTPRARLATLMFRAHGLTPREVEVAEAVWRHQSTVEIARSLCLSPLDRPGSPEVDLREGGRQQPPRAPRPDPPGRDRLTPGTR